MSSATCPVFRKTIAVPLIVFPPPTPEDDPLLYCEPFIVPEGPFTIVWNLISINDPLLVDDPDATYASFPETEGIMLLLGQSQNFTASQRISGTQWAASISGSIDPTSKVDALSYEVKFQYGAENKIYSSTKLCRYDPTIVVSKDPIEPPPPGGGGQ